MLSPMFSILLIPFLVAMFQAITMGGSGTSPAFSAAFGSDCIRKDLIPGLFGIFVFAGAVVAGKKVVLTMGSGVLPAEAMSLILTTIILLSVSLSMLMANILGIPQSTSQATVFALIGPALYYDILKTDKLLFEIIPTWFILPIISFLLTLLIGKFIYMPILRRDNIQFKNMTVHPGLKILVIVVSCYVAFAIGSNNVANAAGPIASMVLRELNIEPAGDNFVLILLMATLVIAPCFGIGSSIFGAKIVRTTGKEIIDFGPLGATFISIITATLLIFASAVRGIPTSLVQLNTAAIIALGITKVGWKNVLSSSSVKKLLVVWIIAPIISLVFSLLLTYGAEKMGLL